MAVAVQVDIATPVRAAPGRVPMPGHTPTTISAAWLTTNAPSQNAAESMNP